MAAGMAMITRRRDSIWEKRRVRRSKRVLFMVAPRSTMTVQLVTQATFMGRATILTEVNSPG
jgi:hypothetical protein